MYLPFISFATNNLVNVLKNNKTKTGILQAF